MHAAVEQLADGYNGHGRLLFFSAGYKQLVEELSFAGKRQSVSYRGPVGRDSWCPARIRPPDTHSRMNEREKGGPSGCVT
ncbi:protein of unknown function [Agreia sp. COWG]|nr:protein of unknown function [Agreia sp. COWG]